MLKNQNSHGSVGGQEPNKSESYYKSEVQVKAVNEQLLNEMDDDEITSFEETNLKQSNSNQANW